MRAACVVSVLCVCMCVFFFFAHTCVASECEIVCLSECVRVWRVRACLSECVRVWRESAAYAVCCMHTLR